MYTKRSKGWLKHWDFMLIDLICLQLAFLTSYWLRHGLVNPYMSMLYRSMALYVELFDLLILLLLGTLSHVLKRGFYKEFTTTVRHVCILLVICALYLFTVQSGGMYSRLTFYLMFVIYFAFTYAARLLWKQHIISSHKNRWDRMLLLVTTQDLAGETVKTLKKHDYSTLHLCGVAVLDADLNGQSIDGVPVVATRETLLDYVCRAWIDEVFLSVKEETPQSRRLTAKLVESGVAVHQCVSGVDEPYGREQVVQQLGGYTVLTRSLSLMTDQQAFLKRLMDIAGGLVGCLLTGLIFLFVAPMIYRKSPGPIFFTQERIGRNGKRFKIYKFRSMYMDAEERKKELLADNRVKDGMMFKLDFDPRVIGNEILPDGTYKTGIGDFIRRTSLDEFPQFYNVLRGEMSLVGTRPPTIDEWEKYELHHRARLAIKPGITGMWQVSGRSQITDFEEVVRLDTEYISNWSLGMDIKILFKTVKGIISGDGAM